MTIIVYTLFCVNLYLVPYSYIYMQIDFVYLPDLICVYMFVCLYSYIFIFICRLYSPMWRK